MVFVGIKSDMDLGFFHQILHDYLEYSDIHSGHFVDKKKSFLIVCNHSSISQMSIP